ncbi:MAG: glycosyltransferase [Nanoarchaeota archaeon]|nr:glycosyltransferase [Nanoarchaeota archaeon]
MENISFIIPLYNAEKTIAKSIESILAQKYKGKTEIIIIDDKSKDKSIEIVKKYKKIKLIENKKNLGLAKSLNKAIKSTKYNLIAIIWCDCVLLNKDWLSNIVKSIKSKKNIAIATSELELPKEIWDKYNFWNKVVLSYIYSGKIKDKNKFFRPSLFKKKILEKVNYYNQKDFRIAGEDTDLKLRILKKGYKIINSKTKILHLHGFYKSTISTHLFEKALPLSEATGVNFRKHGYLGNYWNPITSTIIYFCLFLPYVKHIASFLIIIMLIYYTSIVYKYNKDFKIVFVPFFKIAKDIISIIGFWKGYITGKQTF